MLQLLSFSDTLLWPLCLPEHVNRIPTFFTCTIVLAQMCLDAVLLLYTLDDL